MATVLSIAILGKQGQPLWLEPVSPSTGSQAQLKWDYAAHTSLDFFDERGASNTRTLLGHRC